MVPVVSSNTAVHKGEESGNWYPTSENEFGGEPGTFS